MIEFHETVMGRKFFEGDVPKAIKAVERLAAAVECNNALRTPVLSFKDDMLNRILKFASEVKFDDESNSQKQLKAMWTAYCICNDLEVDTATYNQDVDQVWNAVPKTRCDDSEREFFLGWICEDLV